MIKSYSQLENKISSLGMSGMLATIYDLEKRDSKGMITLGSKESIQNRLVDWFNEKETKHNIGYQRASFVLMQELKKKVKDVV